MGERTRRKRNAIEISDNEWIVVKEKLENLRGRLTPMAVKGEKNKIEEMMEEYVMQFEKTMSRGRREELPKGLITKLNEQAGDRQKQALAISCSPPKTAEVLGPAPHTTTATTVSSRMTTAGVE